MKNVLAVVGLAAMANAFPHLKDMSMDDLTGPLRNVAISAEKRATAPQGAGALPLTPPPFNAKVQKIDVSGAHKFVAPGPTDQRGECPGLNALANHGYLPHNGVATIDQFITATTQVFGMGADLATFLATYGAVVDGTLTAWSIGGAPHTGIGGSHGNYETDSSPLKGDLHQYGSLGKLVISQYKELRDMQPDAASSNYNLDVLRHFRKTRFQESIDKNPVFTYQPFTGMAVSQAAFTFIYRFMANHSAEAPEGILSRNVLNSFMSITGSESKPVWTFGHERIPENWYRRDTTVDSYTIPYFLADVGYVAQVEPRINTVLGCNKGKVDTFSTVDPMALTNGAYTAKQIASNPMCFVAEFLKAQLPGLTGLSSTVLAPLFNVLNGLEQGKTCTPISSINSTALAICPAFSFYGGPTGTVAPGAIQN